MYPIEWKYTRMVVCVMGFMALMLIWTQGTQASSIDDIPGLVNDAIFGGEDLTMAKYLLSTAILVGAGLAMAASKLNMTATIIVLLGLIGFLTALGWVDIWLILLAALVIVALSSKTFVGWITGGGGGE